MAAILAFPISFWLLASPSQVRFVDYVQQGELEGQLLAATVVFRRGGTYVELVSVLHLADPAYWREVQRELDSCDLVFYEAVVGNSSLPRNLPEEPAGFDLSSLQENLASGLGLVFQFEGLNYDRPFFRHADLSFSELLHELDPGVIPQPVDRKRLREIWKRRFSQERRKQQGEPLLDRSTQLFMKLSLAPVFAGLTVDLQKPGKLSYGGHLIETRNDRAWSVLKPYLDRPGRYALLWGAAHMPDFALRLWREGFRPIFTRWHVAWFISEESKGRPSWF